jgi:asparagine synthase (glutamine-hydrolysing)
LDHEAIRTFLRFGSFLNGDTAFQGIKRASPAPIIVRPIEITREQAIEGYIELFRQAVARLDAPIITLSGGRDSRHILLELHRQGRLPSEAVTVRTPGKQQHIFAAQVAERVGIPHRILECEPLLCVEYEREKNARTHFLALEHGWAVPAMRYLAGRSCWDGIGGDVLSAGLFLNEHRVSCFEQGRLDELAESLLDKPDDQVAHRVRKELEKHTQAANPFGSFMFWTRTRSIIAPSVFAFSDNPAAPYLDADLWRFLSSLPARMLLDKSFHSDVIARAYPEFADIPYAGNEARHSKRESRLRTLAFLKYLACRPSRDLVRAARDLCTGQEGWAMPYRVWRDALAPDSAWT